MDRFEKFISPEPNSGCWLWEGALLRNGYGYFFFHGRMKLAHRISYTLYCGEIPRGMNVCHTCDNSICVNPDHLFLGSQADNLNDMIRKNRDNRLGHAKLTTDQVAAIRAAITSRKWGSQKILAQKYGVTAGTVRHIWHGTTWKQRKNLA